MHIEPARHSAGMGCAFVASITVKAFSGHYLNLLQGAVRALGTVSPDVERPKLIYISSTAPNHDRLGHPECAARGTAIMEALQANKLTSEALPGQVCSGVPISRRPTQQSTIVSYTLHAVTKVFLSKRQRTAKPVALLDAKQSLLSLRESKCQSQL